MAKNPKAVAAPPQPKPPFLGQTVYVAPLFDAPQIDNGEEPLAKLAPRDPSDGLRLPEEGKHVAWSEYWARRLADGDIEIAVEPPEDQPETPPSPPGGGASGSEGATS